MEIILGSIADLTLSLTVATIEDMIPASHHSIISIFDYTLSLHEFYLDMLFGSQQIGIS